MNANKAEQMQQVANQVENIKESPLYPYRLEHRFHPVIGEGDLDAKIMLIGEAPGKTEAKTGRPFVGASGKYLDELLQSIGLERRNVYITNIVKDRPPENRDPSVQEVNLYAPFLEKQIEIIQPKVIVTLGRFAMEFILNRFGVPASDKKISDLHGKLHQARSRYGEVFILPLYHPAVGLYNRGLRETLEQDFHELKAFVV